MTVDRVHVREDIELGSYGSKWRHGWIPLNGPATALKLKQLKAGGRHSEHSIGDHKVLIAPTHTGRHGALIQHPDGSSHFLEHDTSYGARLSAQRHPSVQAARHAEEKANLERNTRATPEEIAASKGKKERAIAAFEAEKARRSPALQRAQEVAQERHRRLHNAEVARAEARERGITGGLPTKTKTFKPSTPAAHEQTHALSGPKKEAKQVFGTAANVSGPKRRGVDTVKPKNKYASKEELGHLFGTKEKEAKRAAARARQEQMLPGTREVHGNKYTVKKPGENPFVPSTAHGVEHSNGATIGYIHVKDGKLHIGAGGDRHLPEHQVKNVKEAMAGLHANYTMHEQRISAEKAKKIADAEQSRRAYEAQKSLEQAHRRADQREKDIKSTRFQVAKDEANRKRLAAIAKGEKPIVTKNDSEAKAKVRAAVQERLNRDAVDIHSHPDPKSLAPGTPVKFSEFKGQGIASETHVGHVVHADSGAVHVATPTATYTAMAFRGWLDEHFVKNDGAAGKESIYKDRVSHAANVANTRNHPINGFHGKKSYGEVVAAGLAEMRKRNAAKAAKKA